MKVLAAVCLLAGAVLHCLYGYTSGTATSSVHAAGADDAYISFRYAKNLAEGQGLVWNPGERVEGFTNFLYVLLVAALLTVVPPDHVYVAASGLNLLALLGAMWIFYRLARRRLDPAGAGLALLLFGLAPLLWLWTASGMETVPVVTLFLALWLAIERWLDEPTSTGRFFVVWGVLVLCVLMRADGFVAAAITAAYLVFAGRPWLAVRVVLTVAPVVAACFLCRFGYYGEWLPNTYYAKVDGPVEQRLHHSVRQLWELATRQSFLLHLVVLLVASVLDLGALVRRVVAKVARPRPSFAGFFALAFLAYWLFVGGDYFGERFLIFLYPLGILTFLELARRLPNPRWTIVAAVLLGLLQLVPWIADARFRYTVPRPDAWVTLGKFLRENYAADTYLATDAAGKIPYFSGFRALDMLGLTDPVIARRPIDRFTSPGHDRRDRDYVLYRAPDLIVTQIHPSLDLDDFSQRRYLREGYRLRYLVDIRRTPDEPVVVTVEGLPSEEISHLIGNGYRFGVVEREPPIGAALP